jgi:hypothetical protein
MNLKEQVTSALISFFVREFGGDLNRVCLKGDFSISNSDVNIHLNRCEIS